MSSVDEARQTLAQAEAEQQAAHIRDLSAQLLSVRADLRVARARYRELSNALRQEVEYRTNMHGRIRQAFEEIDAHHNARPKAADYLPRDPDVMAWQEQHDALAAHREALTAELAAYPVTPTVELAYLDGPSGTIKTLEYAENNILRQLDPKAAEEYLKGGIYRVG